MIIAATTTNDELFGGVNDFFDSGAWLVIRNMTIFFVAIFWLATAFWVFKDARRRIEDPWLVGTATLLGLLAPFVGAIIYLFLRPPEYIDDVRERELEIKAMEDRLSRHDQYCPVCRAQVEASFLVCPVCTTSSGLCAAQRTGAKSSKQSSSGRRSRVVMYFIQGRANSLERR